MRDESTILRERQCAMRREMDRRHIALKAVGFDSGIPYSTLLSYFPADGTPAVMPVSAFYCLCAALPNDLLSLLLPDDRQIITVSDDDDHAAHAGHCVEFLADYAAARHPDSECAEKIGPNENRQLKRRRAA